MKNTGSVAGRDVVQGYLNAPHTGYDRANFVEKSDASFVGKWTYGYSGNGGVDSETYAKSLTGVDVTNQFDHAVSDEFTARDKYLTRQDWTGTFPPALRRPGQPGQPLQREERLHLGDCGVRRHPGRPR